MITELLEKKKGVVLSLSYIRDRIQEKLFSFKFPITVSAQSGNLKELCLKRTWLPSIGRIMLV